MKVTMPTKVQFANFDWRMLVEVRQDAVKFNTLVFCDGELKSQHTDTSLRKAMAPALDIVGAE